MPDELTQDDPQAMPSGEHFAPPADDPPVPEPEPEPEAIEPPPEPEAEPEPEVEAVQAEPSPPVKKSAPVEETPVEVASNKRWYVVKVQSGREESIKDAIERRVKIEGLEEFFGQIVIPMERVTEMRTGKRVERSRKLYPGYLMCEVEFNDRILYLFRETSGVGDFVGGSVNRPPPPMPMREVEAMLGQKEQMKTRVQDVKPKFDRGDRVRVKDGMFAGMEGEVQELLEAKNQVKVELTIFGRPVPVELDYWQVEVV